MSFVNGFMTYSLAPASRAAAMWSISVSVVTMTTTSEESSGFWRNCLSRSSPFISGMFQSARTSFTAAFSASITSSASLPLAASQTSYPSSLKILARIIRIALESSTTSALLIIHPPFVAYAGSSRANVLVRT